MEKVNTNTHMTEAIIATVIPLIVLYLLNNYYTQIPILNDDFILVLDVLNFSFILSIILNASRTVFQSKRYKTATEVVSNIVFIYVVYQLWIVFPFDMSVIGYSSLWDTILRVLLILSAVSTFIAVIVQSVKLLLNK